MRLWSIHPSYLDSKGLVALWREGLLAQKVLLGQTKGYRNHPQLIRFRDTSRPIDAIASYLREVANEADDRGYRFDHSKIADKHFNGDIAVSDQQIDYEFRHLLNKLNQRDPDRYQLLRNTTDIRLHPLFRSYPGEIEAWEIIS